MKIYKAIIGVLLLSSFLIAQDSNEKTITSFGRIELNIPADYATFSFKVITEGSSLREALDKANTKIAQVTKDIRKTGLPKRNISTSRFQTGENYGAKSFFSSKSDFRTVISTHLRVDSLAILEELLLTVSDNNVDDISNISYKLKNPEKQKLAALEKAIQKAKEKAELLAKQMNCEIGDPLIITELNSSHNNRIRGGRSYPNPFNAVYEISEINIESGQMLYSEMINVTAEVELKIQIKTE
jgi:uncharacterized protein YggE